VFVFPARRVRHSDFLNVHADFSRHGARRVHVGSRHNGTNKFNPTPPMKNTASLADAALLIDFARASGLVVTIETETFHSGSFETTTINARRAGSGWRDEWVQVIISVRRLGRASVSIATQTNWKSDVVRGLWHARYSLREIVNGLEADRTRAKSAAIAREEAAALAETRRCLVAS
jgi:hypothetical protein